MFRLTSPLVATLVVTITGGCGKSNEPETPATGAPQQQSAAGPSADASGKPSDMVKLSLYGQAQYSSLAVGPDGTVHALFTDATAYGKPHYAWYRASKDGGATWSEAKNLSDDESGLGASWCQIRLDASGRAYAIWKYIDERYDLDGPGGNCGGTLAIRCLESGAWSKPQKFGDDHHEVAAWTVLPATDGKVRLLYTQLQPDVADHDRKSNGNIHAYSANDLAMLTLDGAAPATRTPILTERPLPTKAEIDAAHAAGKDFSYEDSHLKNDGLWNLSGYLAADGRPHFIAEKYQPTSSDPKTIVRYDGAGLATFYAYKNNDVRNTFSDPPALILAGDGREHFVHKPEAAASEVMRDYTVGADGTPGDPTDVITSDSKDAKIFDWNVSALAGGKIAATCAMSPKGMPDEACDLYLSVFDGKGSWSKPINVTDNDARAKFFAKAAVSQSSSYRPTYAEAAAMKSGEVGVLMVNVEHVITGLNTVSITGTGRAVEGLATTGSDNPYVFFTKVNP